jgi:maleate isomerase
VGHAEPDLIAFHCTAVSIFTPRVAGEIRNRITAATGRRSMATADALLAAFRVLQARRVLLVTPYIEPIHQREIEFLTANGLTVVGGSCLGAYSISEMAHISLDAIAAQAVAAASGISADACFISCSAIRSAALIAELEASLRMPVLTSSQVVAWYALRALGIERRVSGFGEIFCRPGA